MGAVLILRWYWWRINAWSEISAMIAPLVIYPIARYGFGIEPPITLYPTVLGTTIVWFVVTYITKPTDENKLLEFYKRTHPGGIGWKRISEKLPNIKSETGFTRMIINWLLGVVMVYSALFGIGRIIFADFLLGFVFVAIALTSAYFIYLNLKKVGFQTLVN